MGSEQTAEEFCRSLEWSEPDRITWLDRTGFVELDGDRRARIELDTLPESSGYPTSGHFTGMTVTILSKTSGRIDAKGFRFDEYLSERGDDRQDTWKASRGESVFWAFGPGRGMQLGWYIAIPATTRPYCQAVERYIDLFR